MAGPAPKVDSASKIMFLLSAIALILVVYIFGSSLWNTYQNNSLKGERDTSQLLLAAEESLKPIGSSAAAGEKVAGAAGRPAKEIYAAVCTSCHASGVLDAPKLDDKAAWEARSKNGLAGLIKTATSGVGSMPAKGGDPSITDTELKNVILYMTKEAGLDLGGDEEAPKAVEAKVETAAIETTTAATASAETIAAGRTVYDNSCFSCHASGVAGAPKLADKAAWEARIATGIEMLYTTAISGKGAMPPKGGNMALEDAKVKAAVDYMVSESK